MEPEKRSRSESEERPAKRAVNEAHGRAAPASAPAAAPAAAPARTYKPSRKVAMIVGYSGKGYSGLQRNPGVRAIEDELVEAAAAAGCVLPNKVDDLRSFWWSRCARTDKGVHALANVVAFNCLLDNGEQLHEVAARINEHLPPAIRVLGLRRVTKSFDAHKLCDCRLYEYLVPVHVLRHAAPAAAPPVASGGAPAADGSDGAACAHSDTQLSPVELASINKLLAGFVGTLPFHNYTSGISLGAPQAKRRIIEAFVVPVPDLRGRKYVAFSFRGQSFLLHQIRKMAAVTIARTRGWLSDATFAETLSDKAVCPLPIAPPAGLMLRACVFDEYNRTYGADAARGPIALTPAEQLASDALRSAQVLPVVGSDDNERALDEWVARELSTYEYCPLSQDAARQKRRGAPAAIDNAAAGAEE
jgi:tRNA pseudouridine38-40 synthase